MKFEEILPFLKEGKMASLEDNDIHYLSISKHRKKLSWFIKIDNGYYGDFSGDASCLRNDWMIYEPDEEKCIKEKKLIDCIVFNTDHKFRLREMIKSSKKDGFELLSWVRNDHNHTWNFTLKMVKYEN